jgi:hypothetical protein
MRSGFVEIQLGVGSFKFMQDKCNKNCILILAVVFFSNLVYSQQNNFKRYRLTTQLVGISSEFEINNPPSFEIPVDSSKPNKNRVWTVSAVNVVGYGASLIILNNAWYKNYSHTSFHTFDDSKEWLQVDKVGHAWTAYNTGRVSAAMWRWAGLPDKKSAVIGGLSGAAYLTAIEFLDAHSSKWGWSWSDIAANFFGAGLFISQELAWNEQRLQIKFSFHKKTYGDPDLEQRADDLFGDGWHERMLKDYNAQTYWLSANLRSFFKKSNLPAWLNVSFGYGADGMYGGFENKWTENTSIDRTDIPRRRQFYFAPDVDLTKIKTNSKFIRSTLFILNSFKFPMPTVEYTTGGKWKVYALYF